MESQIDFSAVRRVLARVDAIMDDHEGFVTDPDNQTGPGRRNDPELARVSRDLVEIGDLLLLAASESRVVWYLLKGKPDPRLGGY